jgi:diguanylate cyclase (GGDEF)-like protein
LFEIPVTIPFDMSANYDYILYFPELRTGCNDYGLQESLSQHGLSVTENVNSNRSPNAVLMWCHSSGHVGNSVVEIPKFCNCPVIGISLSDYKFQSDHPESFDLILNHHIPPAVMAHQIKMTIDLFSQNNRLNNLLSDIDRHRDKLDSVALLGTRLTGTLSRHELYELVVDHAKRLIAADAHILYTIDTDQPVCRLRAIKTNGTSKLMNVMPSFRISEDDRRALAKQSAPMSVTVPSESPGWLRHVLMYFSWADSFLIFPMVSKNHLLGFVLTINTQKQIESSDIELLEILAIFSSISLGNAFVYEQSEILSSIDKLTGVYNFSFVKRYLEHLINNHELFVLIFIDLDGFKNINLSHGHRTGNEALRKAAGKIAESLETYSICGRFGGDEFVVVIPGISSESALKWTDSIIENIETLQEDMRILLSASAGIAEYPVDADGLNSIIHAADTAMYAAKENGGAHTCLFRTL